MSRRRGRLQLWDWERFETGVPLGLDRCHYAVNAVTRRDGTDVASVMRGFELPGCATSPAARTTLSVRRTSPRSPAVTSWAPRATSVRPSPTAVEVLLDTLCAWLGHRAGGATWLRPAPCAATPGWCASRPRSGSCWLRQTLRLWGKLTSRWRLEPAFIIVGAQRAGTTTLYRVLSDHPRCAADGLQGHRLLRPALRPRAPVVPRTLPATGLARRKHGPHAVTFESSGYYLFHPLAAGRIARDLPASRSW